MGRANDRRFFYAHIGFGFARFGAGIGPPERQRENYGRGNDDPDAAHAELQGVGQLGKGDTDEQGGRERGEYQDGEARPFRKRIVFAANAHKLQPAENGSPDIFAEISQHGEECAQMRHSIDEDLIFADEAEKARDQEHMARRRDRQPFGDALYDRENKKL